VVLDVYVLEANRTRTRSLAATIANGVQAGIQQNISFTPRNPRLITGTPPPASENGGGTTTTTTTPANNLIALSQLGRISTNDFSVNLPGAFLQALLEDRQTRVLQNPQVRTVDNKKASLRIGDRYPYATGSLNTGGVGGGVGGIAPVVQTQFQFAEVGVNVDITPKIHGNEEISLRVEVEVSNIRDQVDIGGLRQPVIGQRKLGEDIRIKKGEVNVMGGLTTTNVSRNRRGIPGLIDIPGLSWLFGTDGRDQSDSELLIILVPHLVRAPELTDLNLRGISTGTDTTVKLTYLSKPEEAPESPAATPPMGSVPAAPVPAAPAPAAPAGGGAPAAAPPANFPVLVPTPQPATPQPPTQAPPAQPVPAQPVPLAQFPQTVTPRSDLSAVEMSAAANSINSRNASARIGRPPVLRNKLTLRPVEKEIFLSGPVNVLVDVEYAEDLASAPLLLEYDKQLLKLIAAAPGGLLGIDGAKEEVEVNLDQGKIHVKRPVGSGGVSGNGTLLKLTFASLAKGEAAIRVVTADMVNSRKEPLTGAPLPEIQVEIK
jgi:general secretion pathway protein D